MQVNLPPDISIESSDNQYIISSEYLGITINIESTEEQAIQMYKNMMLDCYELLESRGQNTEEEIQSFSRLQEYISV